MSYQNFDFKTEHGVAWATINRPAQLNAISLEMARELEQIAQRCRDDESIRCVVLTGTGERAFCAGGDVASFAASPESVADILRATTSHLHAAISTFTAMPATVIAAVNGFAAGAGLGLMASADLAIAADSAKFTSAYTKLGLSPDGSTTHFLPRIIGRRRTMELFLLNRVLSAAEAMEWGLVNQVVPMAELRSTVQSVAAQLAAGPRQSHAGVKRLVGTSAYESLEGQMALESESIARLSTTADGFEGVQAFAAKRAPVFDHKIV